MEIYTKIVLDIETLEVVEKDSFEYSGEVALCKGGSSSTTTVDKAYNRRLAAIQERQQDIADEYFRYWDEYQKPYEILQTQSNTELLPLETETAKQQQLLAGQQAQAGQELLPLQTDAAKAKLEDQIETIGMMKPVKTNFFQQAAEGVDVQGRMGMAQADVAKGFADAETGTRMFMSRMGVNPNSGRFAAAASATDRAKAAAVAGARTTSRLNSEDENFRRLATGMQFGMQGV
jgi:hypothetical protein